MNQYRNLSSSEILQELRNSSVNHNLITEAIVRNNSQIDAELERLLPEYDEIRDLFSSLRETPNSIKVKYYPNQNRFESKYEGLVFNLPDKKNEALSSLSQESEFYVELKFIKDPSKLTSYNFEESSTLFSSFVKNAIVGNTLALTIAVTGSIGFYNHLENKANAATPNIVQIESDKESAFLETYTEAVKEIAKVKSVSPSLSALNNHDVKLLLSLQQENSGEVTNLAPKGDAANFEPSEEQVKEAIGDIIRQYSNVKGENKEKIIAKVANSVYKASKTTKIDYLLFMSILKVETTTFDQNKVSHTGDVSIAQIKPEVWEKEFVRLKRKPLDKEKLKKDSDYAISRMGEILSIIQARHSDDPYWYARYNSGTPKHKMKYSNKVQNEYGRFRAQQLAELNDKINSIIAELSAFKNSEEISMLESAFINYDKIDSLKKELIGYQEEIQTNKYKICFNDTPFTK